MDLTLELKQIYIDIAHEASFNPGPEHSELPVPP
jgi:hypothetical protein